MANITGLTKTAMVAIRDNVVTGGSIVGNNLILNKYNGSTIDAGNVRGPQGPANILSPLTAFPGSYNEAEEVEIQTSAMAALGVVWRMKRRGAAPTYKWEMVGGGDWQVTTTPQASSAPNTGTSPTAYTRVPINGGAGIVVPFTGEYMIDWSAAIANPSAGIWVVEPSTSASSLFSGPHGYGSRTAGDSDFQGRSKAVLTAGQTLVMYLASNQLNASVPVYMTTLSIKPIRLA